MESKTSVERNEKLSADALLSAFYQLEAKREALLREGLDLGFDRIEVSAEGRPKLERWLENALRHIETVEQPPAFPLFEIVERASAVQDKAWLLRHGQLVGVWNLETGEIVRWQARGTRDFEDFILRDCA